MGVDRELIEKADRIIRSELDRLGADGVDRVIDAGRKAFSAPSPTERNSPEIRGKLTINGIDACQPTGRLKFVVEQIGDIGHPRSLRILHQEWKNWITGQIEWRAVPEEEA